MNFINNSTTTTTIIIGLLEYFCVPDTRRSAWCLFSLLGSRSHLLAKEIQAPGELPKDTVLINRAFQRWKENTKTASCRKSCLPSDKLEHALMSHSRPLEKAEGTNLGKWEIWLPFAIVKTQKLGESGRAFGLVQFFFFFSWSPVKEKLTFSAKIAFSQICWLMTWRSQVSFKVKRKGESQSFHPWTCAFEEK